MNDDTVPEFAIVGHPNEGKSSVVSTLAEDDSVRISPTPGETIQCQTFPVIIDGREIIRFVDTPGFQNPKQTLLWMKNYQGSDDQLLESFYNSISLPNSTVLIIIYFRMFSLSPFIVLSHLIFDFHRN